MADSNLTRTAPARLLTTTLTQQEANYRQLLALWALGEALYERHAKTLTEMIAIAEKGEHHV